MFGKGVIVKFADRLEAQADAFEKQIPKYLNDIRTQDRLCVTRDVLRIIAAVAREVADE